jgi:hypothetical protein
MFFNSGGFDREMGRMEVRMRVIKYKNTRMGRIEK